MEFKFINGMGTLWIGYEIIMLPVACISIDERIGRKYRPKVTDDDVQTLVRSISQDGLRCPIGVKVTDTGAVIVDGHHRFLAYQILKRRMIPTVIVAKPSFARRVLTTKECDAVFEEQRRQERKIQRAVQAAESA